MITPLAGTGSAGATGSATTPQPRLVRAAHEFEAQLMQELLKPLMNGNSILGDDEESSSSSGSVLGEFATEALGKAVSEQGGLGIANRILENFSHSGNRSETER